MNIRESLHKQGITTIPARELGDMVSKELLKRNLREVERFYRIRRKIQFLRRPIFVLIGGGTGVGKTTMATEVGHQLGIMKIIGTDTIREILRAIIPKEVAPTLHSSSFLACDELKGDSSSNTVLYGFKRMVFTSFLGPFRSISGTHQEWCSSTSLMSPIEIATFNAFIHEWKGV